MVIVSLIFGLIWAFLAAAIGAVRTISTRKPTSVRLPFWTLSRWESFKFVGIWLAGLETKALLFNLGAVGVVLLLVAAFVCATIACPDFRRRA